MNASIAYRFCLIGVLLTCLLSGCATPGESDRAKEGYVFFSPVIKALEAYRKVHSGYPVDLSELVPKYLPAAPSSFHDRPIAYMVRDSRHYILEFTFESSGMNVCDYLPRVGWDCGGFF